ncbi:MAG: acyl-CoA thioesterase [Solirubrobacterales bacterium]
MSDRPARRADYPHFLPIQTRWNDNDVYGHVNNVEYYGYFDTVINHWLITEGGLDISDQSTIGLCVESHCNYNAAISFPGSIDAGLRVAHLGNSSVRYEIGIFERGTDDAAAEGWFVHVFVNAPDRKPTAIPSGIRTALERVEVAA